MRRRTIPPPRVRAGGAGTYPKAYPSERDQLLRYCRGVADLVDGIGMWALESHRKNAEAFNLAVRPPSRSAGR